MDLLNKRGRELETILDYDRTASAYIEDADFVRVKVSGHICYNVPYGNVEKKDHDVKQKKVLTRLKGFSPRSREGV